VVVTVGAVPEIVVVAASSVMLTGSTSHDIVAPVAPPPKEYVIGAIAVAEHTT
jgi:hypothetical protein